MENFQEKGKTAILVAVNGQLIGVLAVADTVKESSKEAIENLKNMGIEVWMITGDNYKTPKSIAGEVGIENIISDVLPKEKQLR